MVSQAPALAIAAAVVANAANAPATAKSFLLFPNLELKFDRDHLYVGSNGLPAHPMMIGITNWQQQVPLPQNYTGDNAWRIPLNPIPAASPAMIDDRFLRGAIALAVNGIPIFNPQNNRGEISYEIGELDQWGGHCGRADDYHYHIAPLHLQNTVGKGRPIAFALDGYPIYGLTEPDGSAVRNLDACNGHHQPGLGYHYHASNQYPYVIGGFHGQINEVEGQVDPQPRAQPVRPAATPLRGAKITKFEAINPTTYKLSYTLGADQHSISYTIKPDNVYEFTYDNSTAGTTTESYTPRPRGQDRNRPPRRDAGTRPPRPTPSSPKPTN
ncbi:YHYH protein [Phragmitibacter flavus]|uniref:YHYH protein n=1 Tax=Phragmitibacter flavus TaxID=2576071 RepID=UPI001981432E|nr:YHYH protein [Phragmitibacter flavus]